MHEHEVCERCRHEATHQESTLNGTPESWNRLTSAVPLTSKGTRSRCSCTCMTSLHSSSRAKVPLTCFLGTSPSITHLLLRTSRHGRADAQIGELNFGKCVMSGPEQNTHKIYIYIYVSPHVCIWGLTVELQETLIRREDCGALMRRQSH